MSETRASLQHQDAEEEITESTDTITERSPTTCVDLGNRDETTISESMRSNQDDDPSSGSTQTGGPDPIDPHEFATSSYTEISFPSDPEDDIQPDEAFGPQEGAPGVTELTSSIVSWTKEAIAAAGDESKCQKLVSFVADDLEKQLRLSSTSPPSSQTLPAASASSDTVTPDSTTLQQIEVTAQTLNKNIEDVIAHIHKSTQSISGLTVECMKAYETCLNSTADTVDANIKSMYQLMAQVEELNKSMTPLSTVKQEVAQVKHLLDAFEKVVL